MTITAAMALRLIGNGLAEYQEMEFADQLGSTVRYAVVPRPDDSKEYVWLGETRPFSEELPYHVVPRSLRYPKADSDSPPCYELHEKTSLDLYMRYLRLVH